MSFDRDKRRAIFEKYRGRCCYCQARQSMRQGTIDHWMPKALGGTDAMHNLRWSCNPCNGAKADMHPLEWLKVMPDPVKDQETRYERMVRLLSSIAHRRIGGA